MLKSLRHESISLDHGWTRRRTKLGNKSKCVYSSNMIHKIRFNFLSCLWHANLDDSSNRSFLGFNVLAYRANENVTKVINGSTSGRCCRKKVITLNIQRETTQSTHNLSTAFVKSKSITRHRVLDMLINSQ